MTSYVYLTKLSNVVIKWPTGGGTTLTVGVGQGGEAVVEFEEGELFGQESVLRQEEWINRVRVRMRVAYAKFDSTLLRELLGTTEADKDVDGNLKTGYTRTYITGGSYDHPSFDVEFQAQDKAGAKEFKVLCSDVIFGNLTVPFPMEDAVMPNLTGTATNIYMHSET